MDNSNKPVIADIVPQRHQLEAGKKYYFCMCGKSANKVFCDGSHAGGCFEPKEFSVPKDGSYSLCTCKISSKLPFCDGQHKKLCKDI